MTTANRHLLYISYNGMLQPLGQSQVIPYLKGLAAAGYEFTLLSYEGEEAYNESGRELCAKLKQELAQANIDWHWLKYHQRPSLPATAYDVWAGIRFGKRLARSRPFEAVHARSHIPAKMALQLKKHTNAKMIFDIRGLLADEYVDAGHWRKGSVAYRLTKKAEADAMLHADGVVTLTERIWPIIREWDGLRGREVSHEVIACCADLQKFTFSHEARAERRRTLGLEDRFVVIYSGSIDGWYLTEEMADFFVTLLREKPNALLLWLTQSKHERIRALMKSRGIADQDYQIASSSPQDVPAYLAAGDAGLAFIKPCFSKLASSPTKYAEYLGCGLPLIINAGVGDSDSLITEHRAGVLINDFEEADYLKAINRLTPFLGQPEQTRERMRRVAEQLFDLQSVGVVAYTRLYQRVLGTSSSQ
jgi:glycosyltransferase involved in cell wall biosynthesis